MGSQDVQQIDPFNYTPEPIEDHPIDREQQGAEGPEPIDFQREQEGLGAPDVSVDREHDRDQVREMDPPADLDREGYPGAPEAEGLPREAADLNVQSLPIERESESMQPPPAALEREAPLEPVEPTYLDRRNEVEAPQPIDTVERPNAGQDYTVPQVDIETPPDYIDPRRLVFRQGPRTHETFYVS